MRIISGYHKGRQIIPPKNLSARPTTDVAKEGLFNILIHKYDFEELTVLDLFSGTGSISYEFASRGCKQVVSVEIAKRHADFIKSMAEKLYPGEKNMRVIQADAFKFISNHDLSQFGIIFADPPYDLEGIEHIPNIIFNNTDLHEDLLVIIEHSSKINFSQHKHFSEMRRYGKVHFSFFKI